MITLLTGSHPCMETDGSIFFVESKVENNHSIDLIYEPEITWEDGDGNVVETDLPSSGWLVVRGAAIGEDTIHDFMADIDKQWWLCDTREEAFAKYQEVFAELMDFYVKKHIG